MIAENRLKVAFVVGSLVQGGAEKQFLYILRALQSARVEIRVYTLTRGEHYETSLRALGIEPAWIGKSPFPIVRLAVLAADLRRFRPQIIQSTHFFANIYPALTARLFDAKGIGSIRNDVVHELTANPFWGSFLLKGVDALIVNSNKAKDNAVARGVASEQIFFLPNVIDLEEFDRRLQAGAVGAPPAEKGEDRIWVAAAGRLVAFKRFDLFIRAIAAARNKNPGICGLLIGDGPEMASLRALALSLGLDSDSLVFAGRRDDVPFLLSESDIFVLTSANEGFPNVLLEAMAAGLPVISTPAGDVPGIVVQDETGLIVPFDETKPLTEKILALAAAPGLRSSIGRRARERVEALYSPDGLAGRIEDIYRQVLQPVDADGA